jgi:hypothetical protein
VGAVWGQTGRAEHVLGLGGCVGEIASGEGGAIADLGEQVAAEQRASGLFGEHVGVPAVGHMGRVEAADAPAAEVVDR